MTNLSGKTALVTGASRGIGRASALALAEAGAQVLVHYGSGAKEAAAAVAEIGKAGGRAHAVASDLAATGGAPARPHSRRSGRAGRPAQARETGSDGGRGPAGYPGCQCRHLESRDN